ncbi:MAG: HEPN domain-containing protein [Desulfuromonadales bacterium]
MEWTAKADADLATAKREAAVVESPNYDAVCFHAQQCAEKYLKAAIVENNLRVQRIHDLEALLNQLMPQYSILQNVINFARILSAMAVEVRYPGMSADEDDAAESIEATVAIRNVVRVILRLT